MFDTLISLAATATLGLAAYGLGRGLWRMLGPERGPAPVWPLALGLVAGALGLTALGLAGGLYRPLIGGLTSAAAVGGCVAACRDVARWRAARHLADETPRHGRWLRCGLWAAAAAVLAAALVAALAPPTAGDALCYHLELPRVFLERHALVHDPYSDNATFPLLAEMLFLWALALDGGVAAQLVHWGLGVVLALGTVELARGVVPRKGTWAAGAAVLLVPGISNQMTVPLNDVALAAFSALGVAAWRRGVEGGPRRWFVVAGVMAGAALGTKYTALLLLAAVGLTWGFVALSRPAQRRTLLAGAAAALSIAVLVGGVWYARAAWHRGNPVYPFFAERFGGDAPPAAVSDKRPLAWRPADLLAAPWLATMRPQRFGGSGHQLGPMFLAALPLLVVCRPPRGLGTLLVVAAMYGLLWYALRQNVRFLYPVVPVLAIAVAWVGWEVRRFPRGPRVLAAAALGLIVLLGVAAPLKRCRDKAAVALGLETRDEFLLRHEPTYRAAVAAAAGPPVGRVLSQDYRAFYLPGRVVRESVYRRRTRYNARLAAPADLADRLRADGFTHVLLAEACSQGGIAYDPTLARLVERQQQAEADLRAAQRSFALLVEYEFADADGALRRYRLLAVRSAVNR